MQAGPGRVSWTVGSQEATGRAWEAVGWSWGLGAGGWGLVGGSWGLGGWEAAGRACSGYRNWEGGDSQVWKRTVRTCRTSFSSFGIRHMSYRLET